MTRRLHKGETFRAVGHEDVLPGVEFTWSEFVRATQIGRMQYSDRPVPALNATLRGKIRHRMSRNRLLGMPVAEPPPCLEPGPCWFCAHPAHPEWHTLEDGVRLVRDGWVKSSQMRRDKAREKAREKARVEREQAQGGQGSAAREHGGVGGEGVRPGGASGVGDAARGAA